MWDGFYFLANSRSWARLTPELQTITARHIDAAALAQRADIATDSDKLRAELTAKGMIFNTPDTESFRSTLREAGFYSRWREDFGDETWKQLEKYTGTLS
jgi:TRAP-type C4-dicarboxylate transport system substrate-binding protein